MTKHYKALSITNLCKKAIFKEPFKINCGTVYYFLNNVIVIRYNPKYVNLKAMETPDYGVKVIYNYKLVYHTTHLTTIQLLRINELIQFINEGENI